MATDLPRDRSRALAGVEEAFSAFAAGAGPGRLHHRMATAGGAIDHSGYPMLRWIEAWAPVRVTDLAERAGLDASTVSRRVSDLQEKGLVTRAADVDDQRASLLELTAHGKQLLATLREARRGLLEEALAGWPTGNVQALADMLGRFAAALAQVV